MPIGLLVAAAKVAYKLQKARSAGEVITKGAVAAAVGTQVVDQVVNKNVKSTALFSTLGHNDEFPSKPVIYGTTRSTRNQLESFYTQDAPVRRGMLAVLRANPAARVSASRTEFGRALMVKYKIPFDLAQTADEVATAIAKAGGSAAVPPMWLRDP